MTMKVKGHRRGSEEEREVKDVSISIYLTEVSEQDNPALETPIQVKNFRERRQRRKEMGHSRQKVMAERNKNGKG